MKRFSKIYHFQKKTEEINNGLFSNYNELLFDHIVGTKDRQTDEWMNGQ